MNELQKIIIEYVKQYPVLIPFLLFAMYYVKNQNFRKLFNKSIKKLLRLSFGNHILAHDLFFQKKLFLAQVKRVKFNSGVKTEVFRVLLEEKVNAVIDTAYSELKLKYRKLKTAHPAEVAAELLSILDLITERFESALSARYISMYGVFAGKQVFDYVYLNMVKPFNDVAFDSIEKRIHRLQFSVSKNYDDILRTFLTKLQDAADDAVIDCEADFNDANGHIDELVKG